MDLPTTAKKFNDWDPFLSSELTGEPTKLAILRVKRDLVSFYTEPPPGLFVTTDDNDFMTIHALILGTIDTPYEGGFFYFVLRFPPDYPIRPPKVRFMTTDGGKVRFNPNLYKNGKVCLSILGTWEGPAWTPAQQLSSLLISIQSLLTDKPYHNEPGFESERYPGDIKRYNEIIQHETLRVAVCGMLLNENYLSIPKSLKKVMEQTFLQYYEHYVEVATNNLPLDGHKMIDPFNDERGNFEYQKILKRLDELHKYYSRMYDSVSEESSCSSNGEINPDDKLSSFNDQESQDELNKEDSTSVVNSTSGDTSSNDKSQESANQTALASSSYAITDTS